MDRIVQLPEVVEMLGVSRQTVWRKVKAGAFPPPLKICGTRRVGWRASDLERWLKEAK